jgi:serine protease Do
MWQHKVGLVASMALMAVVGFLAGDYVFSSQMSSAAIPTIVGQPSNPVPLGGAPSFVGVAKAVTPAVVNITPSKAARAHDRRELRDHDFRDRMEEFFGFPPGPRGPQYPRERRDFRGGGMGSGVIVSPDGYIVTNNHVIDGAGDVTVTLPDKREFSGKVVGTDPKTDLAVVKIDAKDLPYARWGDAAKLEVGEYVLAVGNPFGLNSTVTLGIVSALGRGRMGITQYEDFIQTDAAINPGNSGGALVNAAGELVGINTAIFSHSGGNQGVGFAVPATMAKPVVDSLVKTGKVVRGYLGVGIQDVTLDLAKSFGLKQAQGALVSSVSDNSPAEQAGLKSGDVIVGYDEKPVSDPVDLQRKVARTPINAKIVLKLIRDGKELELPVIVAEQAEATRIARGGEGATEHALAGVEVLPLDREAARELGVGVKTHGVVVTAGDPDSGAERAGLRQGDVIREINRQPVRSVKDFERISSSLKKDQTVLLLIDRRGAALFLSVTV